MDGSRGCIEGRRCRDVADESEKLGARGATTQWGFKEVSWGGAARVVWFWPEPLCCDFDEFCTAMVGQWRGREESSRQQRGYGTGP
jgi:hypothetical protein